MYECGYITKEAGEAALAENISVASVSEEEDKFYNYEVTYAINCAVRYLMKLDGFEFQFHFDDDDAYKTYSNYYDEAYKQAKHKLYTGGYKITTTMNLDAQKGLQKVLDEQLENNTEIDDETGIYAFQGALTVIDNESGKVVAMIGGRSQDAIQQTYSLNRGFQSYVQPGSSFKPLAVYTPALEEGYTANSTLTEINVSSAKNSTSAKIKRMGGTKYSLRRAVEQSYNGCAYSLFNEITPKVGLSYVEDMNFSKIVSGDYNLSAALGGLTNGVNTVEMANAYYTLENHGEYTQTDCISSILDSNGDEIYEDPTSKNVYSQSAADQMTDILTGVLKSGTAKGLKWSSASDIEAAGKTGTTNSNKVGWFCGYTPYYTISVYVAYDHQRTTKDIWGYSYPAKIWKEAMLFMTDGLDAKDFDLDTSHSSGKDQVYDYDDADSSAPAENDTINQNNQTQDNTNQDDQNTNNNNNNTGIDGNIPSETDGINGGNIPDSSDSNTGGNTGDNTGDTSGDNKGDSSGDNTGGTTGGTTGDTTGGSTTNDGNTTGTDANQ